jgi:hypothetical protein
MSTDLQLNPEQQISQLELEIAKQESDVQNLQGALAAIENNQPRPARPQEDSIFTLLRESLEAVPANLEAQRVHQEKLAAVQRTLQLALASLRQKQQRLDALRQEQKGQQQAEAFEQLKVRAEEFNRQIDSAVALFDSMRLLAVQAGGKRLEVSAADLREMPYCSVSEGLIRVRRRFDVK